MSGFLKIYPLSEIQDWQRDGYFGNYRTGINKCPSTLGLPFFFFCTAGLTVSEFKLRPVTSASLIEKQVGTDISCTASWITKQAGTLHDYFYYNANQTLSLTNGFWEYYIKMSDNSEYHSEMFYVPVIGEMLTPTPDFNNDSNTDFKIT
jgi:hypothetical protein